MKITSTLDRLRTFGGQGEPDPTGDGWDVVDDYHRYAGTDPGPDTDHPGGGGRATAAVVALLTRLGGDGDDDDVDATPPGPRSRTGRAGDGGEGRRSRRAPAEADIDPRIAARRRDVVLERDLVRQRRWLAVAVVITVLALGYGATRSGLLDLDAVEVADAPHTSAEQVRSASGLEPGQPLVGLDLDAALDRVRALPWVGEVHGERSWDGTVRITFTERVPAATVVVGPDEALLVDGDRRVLARTTVPPAEVVTVTGVAPAEPGATLDSATQPAIDLAGALTPGLRSRTSEVRVTADGHLEMGLRPAGRVLLGDGDDLDRKVLDIRTVLAQVDLAGLCVLDVRVPGRPVLTRDQPCA